MAVADCLEHPSKRTRTWKTVGTVPIDPGTALHSQLKADLRTFGEAATEVNRTKNLEASISIPGTDMRFRGVRDTGARGVVTRTWHQPIPKSIESILRERIATIESGTGVIAGTDAKFWCNFGEGGAEWLLARMNERLGMRQLWRIAELLAAIQAVSINPILADLEAFPSPRKASALLSALMAVGPAALRAFSPRVESLLGQYLDHYDDAVRSQAAGAIGLIPDHSALKLLREARAREIDDDVIGALEDEIAQRSHL